MRFCSRFRSVLQTDVFVRVMAQSILTLQLLVPVLRSVSFNISRGAVGNATDGILILILKVSLA